MAYARTYDYLFKVVLIGDSGVGKTSILKRYRSDEFSAETKHTIGVEFSTQELEIDGKLIKTQIWDTAGQERYRAITKAYYRGALGAILVYDLTERETFENLKRWIGEIRQHASPEIKIMLIGNKNDLAAEKRVVSVEDGKRFAEENGLAFLEASAKSGDLVSACFETIVKQIYKQQVEKQATKRATGNVDRQVSEQDLNNSTPVELDLNSRKSSKGVKAQCCQTS